MEKIDKHWIKARLAGMPRGSQARLAEHMGIPGNTLSKVMSGTRELQQDEIPKVLSFFDARIVTDDEHDENLEIILRGASKLNEAGLLLLQNQLKALLQTPSLVAPAESSPQGSEPDPDPDGE